MGSLIYSTNIQANICFVVNNVNMFIENPKEVHLIKTKHILRYFKLVINFGLQFHIQSNQGFYTFINSYWRRDLNTRQLTSSLLHKIGESLVEWTSKLHLTFPVNNRGQISSFNNCLKKCYLFPYITAGIGSKYLTTPICSGK
jgi:hypothetical protein